MQQSTGTFQSSDNLKIHTIKWLPDEAAKAVVIIVHGIGEHSGRYHHVAEALVKAGYAVYALDHRGHGQSGGERVQITGHTQYMDDLKRYFDAIRKDNHSKKIFILGHSMGSVISLQFTMNYQNDLAGLVITGTATDVGSTVTGWFRAIANGIHSLMPQAPLLAPGKVDILTRDAAMQAAWENDSLVNKGRTPLSPPKFIIDTGEMLQENAAQLVLPILIMHGEADELTPISGSHIMYERIGSQDKTLKTWPDMKHEVLNEIGREEVIQTIIDWLDKH